MKSFILLLIIPFLLNKPPTLKENQSGRFWVSFGCCFNDSVVVKSSRKVYYERFVKSEEIVGTNPDNSFLIIIPEKENVLPLEVTYKGRNVKLNLDPNSNKWFVQFYFYQDSLYFVESEKGIRDQ